MSNMYFILDSNVTGQTLPTTGQTKASVARESHFEQQVVGRSLEPIVGRIMSLVATRSGGRCIRWLADLVVRGRFVVGGRGNDELIDTKAVTDCPELQDMVS